MLFRLHGPCAAKHAGSAEEYVGSLGGSAELRIRERLRTGHWRCEWSGPDGQAAARIGAPRTLALEMALHEETERRALEGELVELEVCWREAKEIAQIADAL